MKKCDLCNELFTDAEYADRITPHETSCFNYFVLSDECDCDRNYHLGCWEKIEAADQAEARAAEEADWAQMNAALFALAEEMLAK